MDRNQTEWEQMLQYSFQNVWVEMSTVLPDIIAAILILIVGFIVAGALKKIVILLVQKLEVDSLMRAAGVGEVVEKTGYRLNTGVFLGTIVKWFVLIVFFIFALDVLNLSEATAFLSEVVLGYLPRVLIATIILFGAVIIAQFVEKVVLAAATAANFRSAVMLSRFSKYAVVGFAVLAALNELQIATELVQMLFAGFVFALSLALGLSFGLGGRDAAARYIESATRNKPLL